MNIGVVGFGARASHVAFSLLRACGEARLAAIADPDEAGVRRRLGADGADVKLYRSSRDMLEGAPRLDAIVIGTRCDRHVDEALAALPYGAPLFLEKPVATTFADLARLRRGRASDSTPVVVSFPLRFTPLVRLARRIIDDGRIGAVDHVQAVNNVPYGNIYYQGWYRDENVTGGLFLQKATHDFDYIRHLVGAEPAAVTAMTSKRVFRGDRPAGLTCGVCDERERCPESAVLREARGEPSLGDACCFAVDTGNEDAGSALVRFDDGMHAAYSQNFVARRGARARGATLIGYEGTIAFDWYDNALTVHMHHSDASERFAPETGDSEHFGGDGVLIKHFLDVVRGEAASVSTLEDGMISALLCLHARASAADGRLHAVEWPEEAPGRMEREERP